MRHEMAMTRNVRRFLFAVSELTGRPRGIEGMGLLWGAPGEGKSTTVAFCANATDGVFVRANSCWTVTSMLAALSVELSREPKRTRAPMMEAITESLMGKPRPIFVDEADYLPRDGGVMLDTLRDIYDLTGSRVILIGMDRLGAQIMENKRLARRITQWVKFEGVDLADARVLTDTVCEVGIAEDLLSHIHDQAKGNMGRMCTALAKVESMARTNQLESVTKKDWGNRELFYDQPEFSRRPR